VSADQSLLALDDVTIHFEQDARFLSDTDIVHAVDGVSVELSEEDVLVLVGESGCGKTTLGKAAVGLQKPTDGSIKYRGQDIWDAKANRGDVTVPFKRIRRALQIIHQDPGGSLNPNRRVKGILSEPLKKWRPDLNRSEWMGRIIQLLETCQMQPAEDYADRFPHQLSGGEKQRVALVRAMLVHPDVILADEAVSALDVSLRIDMMDLMLELQDLFGTSYIFISHNLSNARYIATKANGSLAVMYLGQIVEIGPPERIIENPRHPYTQVLKWATPDLDPDVTGDTEVPIRGIDIPDPVNPPSGCRFHTRCPEAREACRQNTPEPRKADTADHVTACFREYGDDHEYWQSEPLED